MKKKTIVKVILVALIAVLIVMNFVYAEEEYVQEVKVETRDDAQKATDNLAEATRQKIRANASVVSLELRLIEAKETASSSDANFEEAKWMVDQISTYSSI